MNLTQLMHDVEKISALYAEKFGVRRDAQWFLLKLTEEIGELNQSYLKMVNNTRASEADAATARRRFEDELADVPGQLLLVANHHEVDLETAVRRKWLRWLDSEASSASGVDET